MLQREDISDMNVTDSSHISIDEIIGARSYSIDEIMMNVAVARIDPKQASEILQEFATLLPLQEYNLDHMKRVRRSLTDRDVLEILICPERCIKDVPISLRDKCIPDTVRITTVPKVKPMTRAEYEEWGANWPTMFRPNAVDKMREKGFTKAEMLQHFHFMSLVEKDAGDVMQQRDEALGFGVLGGTGILRDDEKRALLSGSINCHLKGGGIIINPQNGMVSWTSATLLHVI